MNELDLKLEELKNCIGKTDEKSRAKFNELCAYLEEHKEEQEVQSKLEALYDQGMTRIETELKQLRSQIENEYELLPLSYIAREYFNKSRAWLYQRLNGYEVRGRVYSLNEKEKEIFNQAIQDIAQRIGSVHLV